jgi:HK97 family phage prohead protease
MPDGTRSLRHAVQLRYGRLQRLVDDGGPPGQPAQQVRYQASLSSELPVERFFGTEILRHTPEAVNLERAERGLPLLFNHDRDAPVGRAMAVRVQDSRLVAELVFSPNRDDAARIAADIEGGFLGDVSISYSIDEYVTENDEHGHDTVTVTRWTPLEASIVTIPADHTVGVGRSHEDPTMPETINAERDRVTEIEELARLAGADTEPSLQELRRELVTSGATVAQARARLLEARDAMMPRQTPTAARVADVHNAGSRAGSAVGGFRRRALFTGGADHRDEVGAAMIDGLLLRAGIAVKNPHPAAGDFRHRSLAELALELRRVKGEHDANLQDAVSRELAEGRRDVAGMGTTDFPGIVANVANKALLSGWDAAAETWNRWCRTGSVNDFRQANRTGLSLFDRLELVPENSEYKYGKTTDRTEYVQAGSYGKLFRITRHAIVNDDLGAFTAIPRLMGRAAAATVGDVVYDLLTSASGVGPTLNQDGVALFNSASHKNYDADAGSITVANVDVARQKMRLQTDPNTGKVLNIAPRILLVPAALETTATVLVASQNDPYGRSGATGGAQSANPFAGLLEVVTEPRLDGKTNGTTAWYLLADGNMHDTFEVAFLGGQQAPYLEQQDGWRSDGTEFKVRLDFGVSALDFRGMYRKRGA